MAYGDPVVHCPLCGALLTPRWVDTGGAHYLCTCGYNSDSWTRVYYSTNTNPVVIETASPGEVWYDEKKVH